MNVGELFPSPSLYFPSALRLGQRDGHQPAVGGEHKAQDAGCAATTPPERCVRHLLHHRHPLHPQPPLQGNAG